MVPATRPSGMPGGWPSRTRSTGVNPGTVPYEIRPLAGDARLVRGAGPAPANRSCAKNTFASLSLRM